MKNKRFLSRLLSVVAAGAFCVGVVPLASAHNGGQMQQSGSGYLLSHNHNSGGSYHGGGGGLPAYGGGSQPVPEPATWAMFGLGAAMIGAGALVRRRKLTASQPTV